MAPIIQPPGELFETFLNSIYEQKPLKIIETGCMRDLAVSAQYGDGWSTLYIARWVSKHPGSEFHTVDLSANSIELAHAALEAEGLAQYCTFHLQDSLKFLAQATWADFCFLDSCDGLQHGLDEFRLAASTGARLIVMDDYQTKASLAVKEARNLGWDVQFVNRYSVLRRTA
jgi:predicted O-methyltransferase YrrM